MILNLFQFFRQIYVSSMGVQEQTDEEEDDLLEKEFKSWDTDNVI